MRNPDTQRGETLMESLAAILIFTFASVVMLTMLSAANGMNQSAEEADAAWQSRYIQASTGEGERYSGTVQIQVNGKTEKILVDVWGDREQGYLFSRRVDGP